MPSINDLEGNANQNYDEYFLMHGGIGIITKAKEPSAIIRALGRVMWENHKFQPELHSLKNQKEGGKM
jgi:hypothetical protein